MVEIQFPGTAAKEAGAFANRLRDALIAEGVPAKHLTVHKPSRDTMDVGTVLQIDWAALIVILKEHGLTMTHVAIIAWDILKPASKVVIKSGSQSVTLSDSEIDKDKLDNVFRSIEPK